MWLSATLSYQKYYLIEVFKSLYKLDPYTVMPNSGQDSSTRTASGASYTRIAPIFPPAPPQKTFYKRGPL